MRHYWLRMWEKIDAQEVEKSLLVIGLYKAECFSCHNIGLEREAEACPHCGARFKYVSFRDKKVPSSRLNSYYERGKKIIEWDDFLKEHKRRQAKKMLGS